MRSWWWVQILARLARDLSASGAWIEVVDLEVAGPVASGDLAVPVPLDQRSPQSVGQGPSDPAHVDEPVAVVQDGPQGGVAGRPADHLDRDRADPVDITDLPGYRIAADERSPVDPDVDGRPHPGGRALVVGGGAGGGGVGHGDEGVGLVRVGGFSLARVAGLVEDVAVEGAQGGEEGAPWSGVNRNRPSTAPSSLVQWRRYRERWMASRSIRGVRAAERTDRA